MRRAVVLTVLLLVAGLPVGADAATTDVQVRNNTYAPLEVRVRPGDDIRWVLVEGRHTITSDVEGAFDSGEMDEAGSTYGLRAPRRDVTLYYHCRVHGFAGDGASPGSGMVGRIVVGAGSPVAHTRSATEVRRVPTVRWPTLSRALHGLRPDGRYRIDLGPGRYRPVDLAPPGLGFQEPPGPRFELTVRGAGRRPQDVVFAGGDAGVGLSVDGVRVERVSFDGQRFAALVVRDADRWSVDDIVIRRPGAYGVYIDAAHHGRIRRASISGARIAGIAVGGCDDCDLLVDSVRVERSLQGLSGLGAGAIVVRGSTFRHNGVGVALKASDDGSRHRGAHLHHNVFSDNTNRTIQPPPLGPTKDLPVGAGIWLDGGAFDLVEHNQLSGHSFGVVLTGLSSASRVARNVVERSSEADVAWDGLGSHVCFSGNRRRGGGAASAMPSVAQELYACGSGSVLGVPFPLVSAALYAWGVDARG